MKLIKFNIYFTQPSRSIKLLVGEIAFKVIFINIQIIVIIQFGKHVTNMRSTFIFNTFPCSPSFIDRLLLDLLTPSSLCICITRFLIIASSTTMLAFHFSITPLQVLLIITRWEYYITFWVLLFLSKFRLLFITHRWCTLSFVVHFASVPKNFTMLAWHWKSLICNPLLYLISTSIL